MPKLYVCEEYETPYEEGYRVVRTIEEHNKQVRKDTIDECADKFSDILSNIPRLCGGLCPVKCNWGTEESCKSMCKKWLLERLKEQK